MEMVMSNLHRRLTHPAHGTIYVPVSDADITLIADRLLNACNNSSFKLHRDLSEGGADYILREEFKAILKEW